MAAILQETFASGSADAKTRDLVLERLHLTQDRFGGQNQTFRTLSRYYFSLSPSIQGPDNDRPTPGQRDAYPDLFVPRSFTAVEAAVPPWVFAVVGGSPPVKVYARKQEHERGAEAVENMIAYDWERSHVLHRSIDVAKQIFKYGTGIAKISYKRDSYMLKRSYDVTEPYGIDDDGKPLLRTRTHKGDPEEVVRFDGPTLEPVSVFNAGPDPYYHRLEDMRFFTIRRWTDRATLKLEDENHYRLTNEHKYKNLDKIPTVKSGYVESVYQMDYGDDMAEAMGWTNAITGRTNRYVQSPSGAERRVEDDIVELIEYWDRDDKLIILANGETPILDGPNPFDDKELPIVASRCYVIDGQFWGIGYLHTIKRSQEEMNANRNLFYRQGQLNVLNLWGYDEATGVDPDLDMEPGSVNPIPMDANGNPGIVPLYKGSPLPPEAYQIEDRLDRDMQLVNAQPNYNTSAPGGGGTATAASIAQENLQARLRLQALQGEISYTTEVARKFHARRQQFLRDEGEIFRILGAKGPDYKLMTVQDIAGEYDFITAGQHLHASPDVVRQQLLQAISIFKGDPVFLQMTDVYEVWRETWKMFGFQHPEMFLKPPPEDTIPAEFENKVLRHGEWIEPNVMDKHDEHIPSHQQSMEQATTQEAMDMHAKHIQGHQKMQSLQQDAQTKQQEQPGVMQGGQGATPNLSNAAETQGGLQARVGGAGKQR